MAYWRLLKPEMHSAYANMAIDEAILMARIEGKAPNALRFYGWHPSAVSIGRFQDITKEVNLENCKAYGVDVVRRISGGGAVYHDTEDEITYSVVMRRENNEAADVVKAYNHICYGLIEASRKLGINAEYYRRGSRQCPNITVRGRKISGSAQANRKGVILQHGTFLLRIDVDKMFSFLGTPSEKVRAKVVAIARRRLTSIVDELGDEVSKKRICEILVRGFEKALDVDVVEGSLTNHELDIAKKLEKEKFATRKWNLEGKT